MKRTHLEPLPKMGVPGVLGYVQRALAQSGVQEISITAKGIQVTREMVDEEEAVVPYGASDIDIDFLLSRVELLTHPFDAEEHGTSALFHAAQSLETQKTEARWLLAPGWPLTAAWLGVERKDAPRAVYGFQLLLVPPAKTNGRAILLGAPANHHLLSDAVLGISIDLGV